MKWTEVKDYTAMSRLGADIIFSAIAAKCAAGQRVNLGLATGNTMLELYGVLAQKINAARLDLSFFHTWNLDEYAGADGRAVAASHPLSYRKYMAENFFDRLDPALGFKAETQAHFPDPGDPAGFDRALAEGGGLDFQLLGIGFNGHIAFNEPMAGISAGDFAALPTRVIQLEELTIATNRRLTAGGEDIVPRHAVTMGMRPILAARRHLLLACFPEQTAPLLVIRRGEVTPELPASYLLDCPDAEIIYSGDTIQLS